VQPLAIVCTCAVGVHPLNEPERDPPRREVSDDIRSNVFVTSSGMCNPALLCHVLAVTTIERLLFSTDYPFQRPTQSDIQQFMTDFDTDEDRERFTSDNAHRLFGIEPAS
jgi:uncharacterized protein